jgi:protein-disulfide isomerase
MPVTIVEFTDFHCPFCTRVRPTLTQLEFQDGDNAQRVLRDDPIDGLQPTSHLADETPHCANAQGIPSSCGQRTPVADMAPTTGPLRWGPNL